MGHRAVVVFYMDEIHNLQSDPELGRAIQLAAGKANSTSAPASIVSNGNYVGQVMLVEHADAETLMHFSSYDATVAAQTFWNRNRTPEDIKAELLEQYKKGSE